MIFRIISLLFTVFVSVSAEQVSVWYAEVFSVKVAATEIFYPAENESELNSVKLYRLKDAVISGELPVKVKSIQHEFIKKKLHESEPLFNRGSSLILYDAADDFWYHIFLEEGNNRLRLASAEKVAEKVFVVSSLHVLVDDPEFLSFLEVASTSRRTENKD